MVVQVQGDAKHEQAAIQWLVKEDPRSILHVQGYVNAQRERSIDHEGEQAHFDRAW